MSQISHSQLWVCLLEQNIQPLVLAWHFQIMIRHNKQATRWKMYDWTMLNEWWVGTQKVWFYADAFQVLDVYEEINISVFLLFVYFLFSNLRRYSMLHDHTWHTLPAIENLPVRRNNNTLTFQSHTFRSHAGDTPFVH